MVRCQQWSIRSKLRQFQRRLPFTRTVSAHDKIFVREFACMWGMRLIDTHPMGDKFDDRRHVAVLFLAVDKLRLVSRQRVQMLTGRPSSTLPSLVAEDVQIPRPRRVCDVQTLWIAIDASLQVSSATEQLQITKYDTDVVLPTTTSKRRAQQYLRPKQRLENQSAPRHRHELITWKLLLHRQRTLRTHRLPNHHHHHAAVRRLLPRTQLVYNEGAEHRRLHARAR